MPDRAEIVWWDWGSNLIQLYNGTVHPMPPSELGPTITDVKTGEEIWWVVMYDAQTHYLVHYALRDGKPFVIPGTNTLATIGECREVRVEPYKEKSNV